MESIGLGYPKRRLQLSSTVLIDECRLMKSMPHEGTGPGQGTWAKPLVISILPSQSSLNHHCPRGTLQSTGDP